VTAASLLFSCEHASAAVPEELGFVEQALGPEIWRTHHAYDLGALEAARSLARRCDAPLVASSVSRLVADTNRSPHHPRVFSEPVRALPAARREAILARYHRPHRDMAAAHVRSLIPVIHVAVHSFVPALDGVERPIDIALLYDPARARERALAAEWKTRLGRRLPGLRLRRNAPYRGVSDGLPTAFRRVFAPTDYVGFELELNQQAFSGAWPSAWPGALADTFVELAAG
jgi:predicted N-formylglutamate amidohydrolase